MTLCGAGRVIEHSNRPAKSNITSLCIAALATTQHCTGTEQVELWIEVRVEMHDRELVLRCDRSEVTLRQSNPRFVSSEIGASVAGNVLGGHFEAIGRSWFPRGGKPWFATPRRICRPANRSATLPWQIRPHCLGLPPLRSPLRAQE